MARGRFITIEGQDGAGKTTNIKVIKRCLVESGIRFIESREPGGTALGESIRDLILNSNDQEFGDMAELLLMFAARAQHLEEVIEPALSRGDWVVSDRFTDATYAYQGGGRGMNVNTIAALENLVLGELRPDLTILLDVPVEVGETRAGERSKPDRFEQQKRSFKQKVRDCYLARAQAEKSRIKIINSSQAFEKVEQNIKAIIQGFING